MGYFKAVTKAFKNLFGGKKPQTQLSRRNSGQRASFAPTAAATFAPTGPATFTPTGEATFELDQPPLPRPRTEAEEQQSVQEMLEKEGYASAEAAFLAGNVHYVISSNVQYFQYLFLYPDGQPENELIVGFKDGSAYLYEDISPAEALQFYRAGSAGGAVWDHLRVRGTVFGFQKPYRLVEGNRVWHAAGKESIARHEAVPKSGEPYKGYHPATNYESAKGRMGATGIDLGKKGSKKVAYFTPVKSKAGFGPRP